MVQKLVTEKQKELLKILELAKEGENKLQQVSEIATALAQKCETWYREEIENRKKEL